MAEEIPLKAFGWGEVGDQSDPDFIESPSVTEPQWAAMTRMMGHRYAVGDHSHFAIWPTVTDRTIGVSRGTALGWGVQAELDEPSFITLPQVHVDTWFLFVIRRDWTTEPRSAKIMALNIGSTERVPTTYPREVIQPGSPVIGVDDQPLALGQLKAGATNIATEDLRDLRTVAQDATTIFSRSALFNDDPVGTRKRYRDIEYHRVLKDGSPVWSGEHAILLNILDSYTGPAGNLPADMAPATFQKKFTVYEPATVDIRWGFTANGNGVLRSDCFMDGVRVGRIESGQLGTPWQGPHHLSRLLTVEPGEHSVGLWFENYSGKNYFQNQPGWAARWLQIGRFA